MTLLTHSDLDSADAARRAFTPARLTLAREAAQLEVRELAQKIGTTPSAISQLEHGNTKPKMETLLRLSLVLGVPVAFFGAGNPPPLPLGACFFRRRRGAPVKEQRSIVARGQIVREVVRYLEEEMEFPQDAIKPLQTRVSDRADIETLALRIRDAWALGLGPISDVVGLLEAKGVIPVEVHGHSKQLDAFSAWVDGRAMVFLSLDKQAASRRRFDAAHELGHLLIHEGCVAGDVEIEHEADMFASALLLPERPFRAECPTRLSWPALREMKRRWCTSLGALVRRAFDLGIYSEATYRRANVQLNQHGWHTNEPDEPPMERPTLVQYAVEQLIMAGTPTSEIAARVHLNVARLEQAIWPMGRVTAA